MFPICSHYAKRVNWSLTKGEGRQGRTSELFCHFPGNTALAVTLALSRTSKEKKKRKKEKNCRGFAWRRTVRRD
jgi:hypothetical protein